MSEVSSSGSYLSSGGVTSSILDSLGELSASLAQAQYAWGQQQFAQNSTLTNQVVGNYLTSFGTLSGAANQALSQYNQMFVPEMNQLVTDANDYSSAARMQYNMGAAESQTGQAFDQQRQAALQDLQSYGIDPSSGRYAALDAAERSQEAAAEAGAGNVAEQQTEATGRGLRSEAIQVGERLPGEAVSELSAGEQALAGAENAQLANSQEGVNMMGSAPQWAGIGQQTKFPPTLQSSNSSKGQGNQNDNSGSGSKAPPNVSVGSPYGGGVPANQPSGPNSDGGSAPGGYGMSQPGAGILTGGGGPTPGPDITDPPETDPPETDTFTPPITPGQDPLDPGNFPQPQEVSGVDPNMGLGPMAPSDATNGSNGVIPTDTESSGSDDSMGMGGASSDEADDAAQDSQDDSGSSGSDNSFAAGGEVSNTSVDHVAPKLGAGPHYGAIPMRMSPSHGARTDDVPAQAAGNHIRLNGGEFIVPRDVAAWKGEEYFQKLIDQSRAARGAGSAKPTLKPPLPSQMNGRKPPPRQPMQQMQRPALPMG